MTLQRRVMWFVLASAPLVWALGLAYGLRSANLEINELFDTQQLQLARQVLALLPSLPPQMAELPLPPARSDAKGAADEADLSIAVWNRAGRLLLADREGAQLPYRSDADGFVDQVIDGRDWRLYYLGADSGEWRVAVGQQREERDELVQALLVGQLLPWVLTLPALLLVLAAALRRSLAPLRRLGEGLRQRRALDLQPLPEDALPDDLKPLVQALNTLLARVREQIEHERRFTADAAHELRTPLAALQAQWDTAQLEAASAGHAATPAQAKVGEGLARLSRLVAQMLALARLEHLDAPAQRAPIDWLTLVEELFGELLPLAEAQQVELECQWPPRGTPPLVANGDSALLTLMLRNLLDNALRHSPPQGRVTLRLAADAIEVVDQGPGVPDEQLPRLGDRFFRLPGQAQAGSGLGLSIARRIAALHGLSLQARREPGAFVMRVGPA